MRILTPLVFAALLGPLAAGTLEFDETLKEIRAGADERTVTADFGFENKSDKSVTIARYDAGCSCMSVTVKDSKLDYAPGEKGTIRGVFDMGNFSGTVDKGMQVWLEGDPEAEPSVRLTVRVHIPVVVEVEPKTLRWDLGETPGPKTITVTMDHDEPVHVTSVSTGSESFTTELKTIESGKKYEVIVTPVSTERQGLAVINIATDCTIERQASQRAFSMVRKSAPAAE